MIIDTHCHYNLEPLYENWQKHWKKAQENGIIGSVVVGTGVETSKKAIAISEAQPALFAAVGVHPSEISELNLGAIKELAKSDQVIAIGEIGLDYFRLKKSDRETRLRQREGFRAQLELAAKLNLPAIIHVRDQSKGAYWDVLDILKSTWKSDSPFILHCISGPLEYVTEAIKLGAYIGVAGNAGYPNSGAIRELITQVPKERLLLETDAPFLPPQAHRGKSCEPRMIKETAWHLTHAVEISTEEIITNTNQIFPQFQPFQANPVTI
ncbi:MAG: hypothetical protein COY80_01150 [Candidatus Pacebacteria bacterium CG_4_10_14_0_8_um_filter_42_14]|nr:MAG: hypothetical protein COY80_01150 [Candidatus Pacebacteria bacterium CG_4_10_14_0_8_um_filter_42_14]